MWRTNRRTDVLQQHSPRYAFLIILQYEKNGHKKLTHAGDGEECWCSLTSKAILGATSVRPFVFLLHTFNDQTWRFSVIHGGPITSLWSLTSFKKPRMITLSDQYGLLKPRCSDHVYLVSLASLVSIPSMIHPSTYVFISKMLTYRISHHQHGFLCRKSTSTQLLECCEDWNVAMNTHSSVDVVYLDFAKAFCSSFQAFS